MTNVIGIDIGGTQVKIGVFDASGGLLKKWSIPTNKADFGAYVLKEIYESINQNVDLNTVVGYGFGVPGPVQGQVVLACVNIGWKMIDVKQAFSKFVGDVLITVDNDANLAALGETRFGAGNNAANSVMFTLGTGVGGGVVIEGKLLKGAHGVAGEIGHMKIVEDGMLCNCQNTGCLETLASATGIKALTLQALRSKHYQTALSDQTTISAKEVFELAEKNDPLCAYVIDEVAYALAKAAQILSVIVDPEVFIFGGGISNAGMFLLDKITAYYQGMAFSATSQAQFKLAKLGNDAGIYGAFQAVINHG